jgi:uncharacterized protein YciI
MRKLLVPAFTLVRRLSVLKAPIPCSRIHLISPARPFQQRTMSTTPVKRYLLEYTYVENMVERRAPYRAEHLANAEKLVGENVIIVGGAFMPNADGALFIFQTDKDTVERFVQADPYYRAGLIPKYKITEWNVVVGKL